MSNYIDRLSSPSDLECEESDLFSHYLYSLRNPLGSISIEHFVRYIAQVLRNASNRQIANNISGKVAHVSTIYMRRRDFRLPFLVRRRHRVGTRTRIDLRESGYRKERGIIIISRSRVSTFAARTCEYNYKQVLGVSRTMCRESAVGVCIIDIRYTYYNSEPRHCACRM